MHPDISEFSYGYALTEALVHASPIPLKVAPVFPSLIDEGKFGGYDVHLPFEGFPLFLQFKLSHKMVRGTATEAMKKLLTPPFYRMYLRPLKHSQQHSLLLATEASGVAVYYAAPCFHEPGELNDAYVNRQIVQRSIFVKPSVIGALPDGEEHHISFKQGSGCYLSSNKPRLILEKNRIGSDLKDDLRFGFERRERLLLTEESAKAWATRLQNIVKDCHPEWVTKKSMEAMSADRSSLSKFAYLAHMFLGCSVVVIAPK